MKGNTVTLSHSTLSLASKINRSLELDYLDYLASCESYRRDGYRPATCEHGTNMWTDYDNICGPCEDGLTMGDPIQRRQFALDSAKRREEKIKALINAASTLRDLLPRWEIPGEVWEEVTRLLTP